MKVIRMLRSPVLHKENEPKEVDSLQEDLYTRVIESERVISESEV